MSSHREVLPHAMHRETDRKPAKSLDYYRTLGRCLLLGKSWQELEHTIEETSKPARLKGGFVCLPVDPEHQDIVAIHAAPFNAKRRVDHLWDEGADVYLLDREDVRSSSRVHIEPASGVIESSPLSKRSIADLVHFIRQYQEQAVASEELLHEVADRERNLYEQLHVDITPIT